VSRSNRLASPGAPRTPGGGSAVAASEIARVVNAREPETALALAEEVLGRALKIGATEAEVLVMAGDAALTRFANSEIHQNVVERSLTVNLRYIVGKRIAVVSTGKVDTDGLRSLVNRAAAIARSCEELEDWAGLPGPDRGQRRDRRAGALAEYGGPGGVDAPVRGALDHVLEHVPAVVGGRRRGVQQPDAQRRSYGVVHRRSPYRL